MIFYLIILILFLNNQLIYGLSCRDPQGRDIDWFFAYKPPTSELNNGRGYVYKLSSDKVKGWTFSDNDILNDEISILYQSIFKLLTNRDQIKRYNYIMYNDVLAPNTPSGTLSPRKRKDINKFNYGSSKGIFVWSDNSALLFTHSLPFENKDINLNKYAKFGNTFLCITIDVNDVKTILKHLMLIKVRVYNQNILNKSLFEEAQNGLYGFRILTGNRALQPRLAKNELFHNLRSKGGQEFTITALFKYESFSIWEKVSRTNKFNKQLSLKSYPPVHMEIKNLKCGNNFAEILAIKISDFGLKIEWEPKDDLSNFGICRKANCFCVTNLNRIPGNKIEYGGAICLFNKYLKETMEDSIKTLSCEK